VEAAHRLVDLLQPDGVGGIAEPAVKLGPDPVEIFGLGALLDMAVGLLDVRPALVRGSGEPARRVDVIVTPGAGNVGHGRRRIDGALDHDHRYERREINRILVDEDKVFPLSRFLKHAFQVYAQPRA